MEKTEVIEYVRTLWENTPPSKRREVFQKTQTFIPDEHKVLFKELVSHHFNGTVDISGSHVLILVHGIHTNGSWQQDVQDQMEGVARLRVRGLGYELVTGPHFALFSRTAPITKIVNDIRIIKREEPLARISVIAHSFGTYITCRILEENPDIQFYKIITCGSVVRRDYNWAKHAPHARHGDIVNDVGIRDFWPVAANCITAGYGASGSQGFQSASVIDRFFNYGHSDFFEPKNEHIRKYWRPIFENGAIIKSDCKLPKGNLLLLWFCHSKKGKIIPFLIYFLILCALLWVIAGAHLFF